MALPIAVQPEYIKICFENNTPILSEKAIAADYAVGEKLLKDYVNNYEKKLLW